MVSFVILSFNPPLNDMSGIPPHPPRLLLRRNVLRPFLYLCLVLDACFRLLYVLIILYYDIIYNIILRYLFT